MEGSKCAAAINCWKLETRLPPSPSRLLPADLRSLTALRFVAALMIFLLHLREFAPAYANTINPAVMNQGVSFFFVLSGFVLTHAYAARSPTPVAFLRSRLARIYPTHLAALALIVAVLPASAARFQNLSPGMTLASLLAKVTLIESWFPISATARSWNSVSWSISAELSFYLAFPFLLTQVKRDWRPTLAFAGVVTFAVYALGLALGLPTLAPGATTPTLYYLGTCNPLARGFEFVLGMAAYQVVAPRLPRLPPSAGLWTAIETSALLLTTLWLGRVVPAINDEAQRAFYVWFHASGSALVFAALIAAMAGGRGAFSRALGWRPLVLLGESSFAFYMVHTIVLRALRLEFGDQPPVLLALAIALLLAFLFHFGIEKPIRVWIVGGVVSKACQSASKVDPISASKIAPVVG
jgi:peptidoglycan/LPS O-acetylase OafA/YrhL